MNFLMIRSCSTGMGLLVYRYRVEADSLFDAACVASRSSFRVLDLLFLTLYSLTYRIIRSLRPWLSYLMKMYFELLMVAIMLIGPAYNHCAVQFRICANNVDFVSCCWHVVCRVVAVRLCVEDRLWNF
jgi:hypothetical protein